MKKIFIIFSIAACAFSVFFLLKSNSDLKPNSQAKNTTSTRTQEASPAETPAATAGSKGSSTDQENAEASPTKATTFVPVGSGPASGSTSTGAGSAGRDAKSNASFEPGFVIDGIGPVKILEKRVGKSELAGVESEMLLEASGKYTFLRAEFMENKRRPRVMAADHVLVQFDESFDREKVQEIIKGESYEIRKKFIKSGLYAIRSTKEPSLDFVRSSIVSFPKNIPGVKLVEPDYLVHASGSPESEITYRPSEEGVVWSTSSLLNSAVVDPPSNGPKQKTPVGVTSQITPLAARTITFDPPGFLGGKGSYSPYLDAQNMRFEHPTQGMYVQDAYSDGYPASAGLYAKTPANTVIRHSQNISFTLHSLDIAEYSTVYPNSLVATFSGTKTDGSTVSHVFTTDGGMDGSGPNEDWETVNFPSSFTDLIEVKVASITGGGFLCHTDNIQVTIGGQELPPPAPPTLPLYYDMTFDSPIHTVDEVINIGGRYSPKSINFGAPYVRANIGGMTNAVEMKPGDGGFYSSSNYEQFRVALGQSAAGYRVEMDVYIDSQGPNIYSDSFSVLFDGPAVQRFDLKGTNQVSIFQSGVSGGSGNIGTYQQKQIHRLRFDIDMENGTWKILMDGNVIRNVSAFNNSEDLDYFRVHFSDSSGGTAWSAVDNIKVSVFEPGKIGNPLGPVLSASPMSLSFGNTQIGQTDSRTFRLSNQGDEALTVSSVTSSDSAFSTAVNLPISIPVGGSRDINVAYSPLSSGEYNAQISLVTNASNNPNLSIPVSGVATGNDGLNLSEVQFPVTVGQNGNTTRNLTIQNGTDSSVSWGLLLNNSAIGSGSPNPPNDPKQSYLWGLQDPSIFGGGIGATEAWKLTTGAPEVVVAVIDTGVDYTHPDLSANVWANSGEIAGNGIDDDNNGFIDDVRGWDFYNNDANPMDGNRHGTHVAGTIAASGNNGTGVVGVGWNTTIMPIKFLSDAGSGWTSDAIDSVDYATNNGAHLTNNSWGGGGSNSLLQAAIQRAANAGSLFVAAAGNDSLNNDGAAHFPSSYNVSNVLSVASTTSTDGLSYFSNYGVNSVDLGAPGSSIYSTLPNNRYGYLSGTSMATPHVAGAAALLLSQEPGLGFADLKQRLMSSADPIASLTGKTVSGGRLNILKALGEGAQSSWLSLSQTSGSVGSGQSVTVALAIDGSGLNIGQYSQMIQFTSDDPILSDLAIPVSLKVSASPPPPAPLAPLSLSATPINNSYASLSWSEVATADGYRILRSTTTNSSAALVIASNETGTTFDDQNVVTGTTYYYWVRGFNESGNGDLSPMASAYFTPPLPAPASLTGVSTNNEWISLSWSAVTSADDYQVFRSATLDFTSASLIAGNITSTTYEDHTAVIGVTYHYWVRGINEIGAGSLSPVLSIAVTPPPAPPAPADLSAITTNNDFVSLSWSASAGADGYRVLRGATSDPADAAVVANILTGTTHEDHNLSSGVNYNYWVRAFNAGGNGEVSLVASVSLLPPPAFTAEFQQNSVLLSINAVTGADGYHIYRSSSPNSASASAIASSLTATSFEDTDTSPGNTYYYWIRSYDSNGNSRLSQSKSVSVLGVPTSLTTQINQNGIVITWAGIQGATSYRVYRGVESDPGNFTLIAITNTGYHLDPYVSSAVTYLYYISATVGTQNGGASASVSATWSPPTPSGLSASSGTSDRSINISWESADGAVDYIIYRNTEASEDGAIEVGRVPSTGLLSFTDSTAVPGTSYFYSIKSDTHDGESVLSDWEEGNVSGQLFYRPDGMIGARMSSLAGNNRYNLTGVGQRATIRGRGMRPVSCYFKWQFDGTKSDRIRLRGTPGNRLMSANYYQIGKLRKNITSRIKRGVFYHSGPSGDRLSGRIFLKRIKKRGTLRRIYTISGNSIKDTQRRDTIKGSVMIR